MRVHQKKPKAQNINCGDQNPMHVDDGSEGMEKWNENNNFLIVA